MTKQAGGRTAAVERALRTAEREVMALPDVNGVAQTEVAGVPHIAVYVKRLTKELRAKIADQYDGVPVKIEVTEPFEAQ